MRYQRKEHASYSNEKNIRLETEAHDKQYDGRCPFGLNSLSFSPEQVWHIHDYAFKPGTYRRGYRKRRLFEFMDLENIGGNRVLEVGCGIGQHCVFFAMYGAEVYGFDLSSKGIEMALKIATANNVADRCRFSVANVSEMPYEDEQFDVVVCNAVLHHVMKYPNVENEIFRVIKPGGYLYLAEGLRSNALYRFARKVKRIFRNEHYHGDIDLEFEELKQVTRNFSHVHYEFFCLIEKFAQGFGREYGNNAAIRLLYRCANYADRALIKLLPPLQRQCLEVVGVAKK